MEGRKRLWSDQDALTDELTRVGKELLGQLKNERRLIFSDNTFVGHWAVQPVTARYSAEKTHYGH